MKIAVGFDHAGFPLKQIVLDTVRAAGHEPIDMGTNSTEPVDFPDYSEKVGRAIQTRRSRAWDPGLWFGGGRVHCCQQNERCVCRALPRHVFCRAGSCRTMI